MQNQIEDTDADNLSLSTKPVFPLWAKDKINALKNLQIKITGVESKFFEEIQDLERKYIKIFNPLFDERMQIITGKKDKLNEEETKWNYEESNDYQDIDEVPSPTQNGLPDFWLEAFRSSKLLSSLVQEHDENIFKHLIDVRCKIHEQKPYGYTIEFHFSENEYFTNKVLTKTYELISEKDENRPFLLAKGHFYKCKGCTIDWKKGKNLSVQIVKSKEEDKKSNLNRIVTKEEQQDTFFTFFVTPNEDGIKPCIKALLNNSKGNCEKKVSEDEDNMNHDLDTIFDLYFEIGQYLKDTFLPKAILYYTGEINEFNDEEFADEDLEDYDDEDSDNDDEEDDDENEENDDNEHEDEVHQSAPRKKSKPQ